MCSPPAAPLVASGSAGSTPNSAALGWSVPPRAERYALLEDALERLPIMWGKGTPRYEGRVLRVPETSFGEVVAALA